MKKTWLPLLLLISCLTVIGAQTQNSERPFTVDIDVMEPCVMIGDSGKPYGFDIELFNKIAEKIGIGKIHYRQVSSFKEMFTGIESGLADAATSGITITSKREKEMDFSHRYLEADIKALVKAEKENGFKAVFGAIFKKNVIILILIVILFALLCSLILWVLERKISENQKVNPLRVIFDFFYMVIVTVSTVGYGDRTAKTIVGKFMVVLVILSGLAIFGCYIGTVTTNIQFDRVKSDINNIHDLQNKKIATVANTYAAEVISNENIGSKVYKSEKIEDAIALLKDGTVSAVIFDAPPLLCFARQNTGFAVSDFSIRLQDYGYALPTNSPWRDKINQAILELQESGDYQRIYDKWFGNN
jgi:polar amino acid transport system substrate-binding protein